VQPYLFARFVGSVELIPQSDFYFNKYDLPDVVVNYTGENDGYSSLQSALSGTTSAFDAEFGHWETRSTGAEIVTNEEMLSYKDVETWRVEFLEHLEESYNEKDCYMCANKVPEEGIVLRVEKLEYYEAYKLKSKRFILMESDAQEKEETNLEDNQDN
jgi:hypothetical protein